MGHCSSFHPLIFAVAGCGCSITAVKILKSGENKHKRFTKETCSIEIPIKLCHQQRMQDKSLSMAELLNNHMPGQRTCVKLKTLEKRSLDYRLILHAEDEFSKRLTYYKLLSIYLSVFLLN